MHQTDRSIHYLELGVKYYSNSRRVCYQPGRLFLLVNRPDLAGEEMAVFRQLREANPEWPINTEPGQRQ